MRIPFTVVKRYSLVSLLARGGFVALVIKIANAGLLFVLQIVLARLLGAAEFGSYMFAIAWVNILLVVGKLGFDTTALRFVASFKAEKKWKQLKTFVYSASRLVLLSSFLVIGIFILSTVAWGDKLSQSQYDALIVAMPLVIILSLMQLHGAILRGLGHIFRSQSPFSLIRHLLLLGVVTFCYLYGIGINAFLAQLFTNVAGFLALMVLLYWMMKEKELISAAGQSIQKSDINMWIATAFPMMVIGIFQAILSRADVIIVNLMIDSESGGIYAAMSQLSQLALLGQVSINTVVAPMIAKLTTRGKARTLQDIITLSARLSFGVTLVVGFILLYFGEWIISLYGESFIIGYKVLIILVVAQLINALAGSVGYLMSMTGNHKLFAVVIGISATLNIILNILLVPRYGIVGAAIATAITTALWNFVLAIYSRRRLGIASTAIRF